MSHVHWVELQNKLKTPKEKDEVNKREVHECDVRTRNPDAMVVPPTPKPTCRDRSSRQGATDFHLKLWRKRCSWEVARLLFIIRVKWELKRVYRNGCRCNERLNTETGGSKTPRIHWVALVNIHCHTVSLVLLVTVVYFESIKQELKIKGIHECRFGCRTWFRLQDGIIEGLFIMNQESES